MTKITTLDYITRSELEAVKHHMSVDELATMNMKIEQIVGNTIGFSTYEARLLAKHMFELGYLASYVEIEKSNT